MNSRIKFRSELLARAILLASLNENHFFYLKFFQFFLPHKYQIITRPQKFAQKNLQLIFLPYRSRKITEQQQQAFINNFFGFLCYCSRTEK